MPEISDEEYAVYQKLQQLGNVEDISKQLTEYRKMQRALAVEDAARIAGYNPKALGKLIGDLEFSVKETENGKQAFILQGEEEVSLQDYAEQEWSDFLPALTINSATTVEKDKNVRYIPQRPSNGSKRKDPPSVVEQYLKRTYQFDKE